jgi:condensation enzyme
MTPLVVPDGMLPRVSDGRVFPLSVQQESTCIGAMFHPPVIAEPHNCIHLVMRLMGDLNPDLLQLALDDVVGRHSSLRTRYAMTADNVAVQEELPGVRRELVLRDAVGESPADVIASMRYPAAPFHEPPALRVEMARLGDGEHILGVGVHHLACDAAGAVVLAQDLSRAYAARRAGERLPPLELGYGDFAVWQRRVLAERLEGDLLWWRALLQDYVPAPLRLDRPFTLGMPASNAAIRGRFLDGEGLAALRRLALRRRSSPFVTLVAVSEVVTGARRTGADHLVCTFLDQRDHPATRDMVGYFLGPAAVRFAMADGEPIAGVLDRLTRHVLEVSDRARGPIQQLLSAAPALLGCIIGATPPGPIFVQLQARAIPGAYRLGEAAGEIVADGVRGPSEPGLTLKFVPTTDGGMDLEVGYEPRHFAEDSLRNLLARTGDAVGALLAADGSTTPAELLARVGAW